MTSEEILKKWNITPDTKYHRYEYLYKSMVEIVNCLNNQIQAEKQTSHIECDWRDKIIGELKKTS